MTEDVRKKFKALRAEQSQRGDGVRFLVQAAHLLSFHVPVTQHGIRRREQVAWLVSDRLAAVVGLNDRSKVATQLGLPECGTGDNIAQRVSFGSLPSPPSLHPNAPATVWLKNALLRYEQTLLLRNDRAQLHNDQNQSALTFDETLSFNQLENALEAEIDNLWEEDNLLLLLPGEPTEFPSVAVDPLTEEQRSNLLEIILDRADIELLNAACGTADIADRLLSNAGIDPKRPVAASPWTAEHEDVFEVNGIFFEDPVVNHESCSKALASAIGCALNEVVHKTAPSNEHIVQTVGRIFESSIEERGTLATGIETLAASLNAGTGTNFGGCGGASLN